MQLVKECPSIGQECYLLTFFAVETKKTPLPISISPLIQQDQFLLLNFLGHSAHVVEVFLDLLSFRVLHEVLGIFDRLVDLSERFEDIKSLPLVLVAGQTLQLLL